MPELPEVETIRRVLSSKVRGRVIKEVLVQRRDAVGFPDVRRFRAGLTGNRIIRLERRGKYLVFYLERGCLVVHLRLSGHLRMMKNGTPPAYERVRFVLDNQEAISFVEPRVLGKVYFLEDERLPRVLGGLKALGREPVDPEFSVDYLRAKLRGRRAKIKSLLIDQSICAGVGNIYSDEALFRAGIKPTRPAGKLTRKELFRLVNALRMVLKEGIRWKGTTMVDERYKKPDGGRGGFQRRLMVVGRVGESCQKCGATIRRIKIANRSSYYCPGCQH